MTENRFVSPTGHATRRPPSRARFAIALGASFCASLSAAGLAFGQELNGDIQRFINQSRLGAAKAGVCIIDASTGEILASIKADEPLTPASNLKILTSGAALLTLGADYEFKTQLLLDGDRLILKGGGDPALGDPRVLERMSPKRDVEDVLSVLVAAATQAGVKSVSEIIVDDRIFDRAFVNPAWPEKHLHHAYGAEVAGLNFHANVLYIFTEPGPQGVGTRPAVSVDPGAPWLPITVKGQTVAQNKNSAWVTREADSNAFTLLGEVGTRSTNPIEITLHDTPDFLGHLLADRLARAGITIAHSSGNEASPAVRAAAAQEKFAGARVIGMITTPISEVLRRCNTDSENLYAESMLKAVGNAVTHEPGSWENGAAVVRMMLSQRLGPEAAATTTMLDGSGLAREDHVAPQTLARWLALLSEDKSAETYINSFAEPGKSGTLEKRFQGMRFKNDLRGKSGFINGVRSLSGYLTSRDSRRVVFSVIVNDITTGEQTEDARKLHEHVAKIADDWLAKQHAAPTKKGG